MKLRSLFLLAILIPLSLFFSCDLSDLEREPIADFHAKERVIHQGEEVKFRDRSLYGPTEWAWVFEGGVPSSSRDEDPEVIYMKPGIYPVSLTVSNSVGEDTKVVNEYIIVEEKNIAVTFKNSLFTDFQVTVRTKISSGSYDDGVTKEMKAGDEVVFDVPANSTISYYAETYGRSESGNKIGETMGWSYEIDIQEDDLVRPLALGPDYFFLFIQNYGGDLQDLYVNYGMGDKERYDEILIKGDGLKYKTGYYPAVSKGKIRMSFADMPSEYVEWVEGEQYNLTNDENQYVEVSNNIAKKNMEVNSQGGSANRITTLIPASGIELVRQSVNAKADYPNATK